MKSLLAWDNLQSLRSWLPAYVGQRFVQRRSDARHVHVIISVAEYFEPSI